jgi:acyl carrier protein
MPTIESRIRAFLGEQFQAPDDLPAAESLLEGGIIDSIGVLTLVTWLEEAFGFLVDDEDVLPENLDGIGNLVAYVQRKLDEAAAAP